MTIDAELARSLVNLELVATSKRIVEPFEDAYQWIKSLHLPLEACETVGSITFTGDGQHKISHLTWSDLTELHHAYQRFERVEKSLAAIEAEQASNAAR